jgi:GNAT superfamily N-acetyltransferase
MIVELIQRKYQHDQDYWRIRQFLRQVFLLNQQRELAWQAFRFDYWLWHVNSNIHRQAVAEIIDLWETPQGAIAAVLTPEGPLDYHLQVHPAHRSTELEAAMIRAAVDKQAAAEGGQKRRLLIWTRSDDSDRQRHLEQAGFHKEAAVEQMRRRALVEAIPDHPPAEGYQVRALGGPEELPARSWLSWRAFHPDEPDEKYEGWEWYRNVQRCPLYRRDLDLVAVAPDGELAAFCTVWFDDVTRSAALEPVGTAPEHQRRGLGKAVIAEGLRRALWLGALYVFVGSYSEPAHSLYAALGLVTDIYSEMWLRPPESH